MQLDIELVKKEILSWVEDVIEVPRDEFNGRSACPFARQSRLNNTYDIRLGTTITADLERILDQGLDGKEVIAIVYPAHQYSANDFGSEVEFLNKEILVPYDLIALSDHPDEHEVVMGLTVNHGTYALIFVQSLSKLNNASRALAKQGFYNGWDAEYLKDLFQYREIPPEVQQIIDSK